MSTDWTPEAEKSNLAVWLDGQDPNGNNGASAITDGAEVYKWLSKRGNNGGSNQAFYSFSTGAPTTDTAYRPEYMLNSIVELTITNAGTGYGTPSNTHTERDLHKVGGARVPVRLRTENGVVQSVTDIGPSYGYSVGDQLVEVVKIGSSGAAAVFTVTKVIQRGGFYFNQLSSDKNFFMGLTYWEGIINQERSLTFIVSCILYGEQDTFPIFKWYDSMNQGTNNIAIVVDNLNTTQGYGERSYTEGLVYNDANGNSVSTADANTDNPLEGVHKIYTVTLSQIATGSFRANGVDLNQTIPIAKFPSRGEYQIMTGSREVSDTATQTTRGAVFELLIFDKLLDLETIKKCEGYLNQKYQLNCLDANHFYTDETPVINDTSPIDAQDEEAPPQTDNDPNNPLPTDTADGDELTNAQDEDDVVESLPPVNNPTTPIVPLSSPATATEQTSSGLFNGAHRLSPRKPIQVVEMLLDFCDNEYGVNNTLSSCTASGPSGNECYNTRATCQDLNNYDIGLNGKKRYLFRKDTSSGELGYTNSMYDTANPCIISVTSAPVEIMPTKGVALRANITIKLRDFYSTGATVDPYFESRNLIALESGSYFQKLIERNPHYVGRPIRVYDGYIDHAGYQQLGHGGKFYIIDKMSLNKDVLTITCKDPMSLADNLKAKVPEPSKFSLKADLAHGTQNSVVLKVDNADASAEKMHAYFGLTGHCRIEEEIIKYTRLATDAHISFHVNNRGAWGSKVPATGDSYDAGEVVQKCVVYGEYDGSGAANTINNVAYDLLINEAKVPARAIRNEPTIKYSWADEKTRWLETFRIDAIFSEPKEVNKQLAHLASMVGVNFFYDDRIGLIRMRAETPELDLNKILTITDDNIVKNSLSFSNNDKDRVSRVYYYYNMRDHTADRDKPKNFKNLYVAIDIESEIDEEYGKSSNKTIYAYGVNSGNTATTIAQRLLSRFKNTPKTVKFKIDASLDILRTGDHFYLTTEHIVDFNGVPKITEFQCLSVKFDSKKLDFEIKAKQFRFSTVNTGVISNEDVVEDFDEGTGDGTDNDPYDDDRAINPYLADANHITVAITDVGSGFAAGDTLIFTPDETSAGTPANTRNLAASFTLLGTSLQSVTITSNAAAGSLVSAVHDGYAGTEILQVTSNNNALASAKVRITKKARMSGGQEPYKFA
tara:strand:- start:932 stop:4444 length:3513 start_codon:yes stop_codon:yes gene_type:complete